jgi:Endonuclease-reverse transcriptase
MSKINDQVEMIKCTVKIDRNTKLELASIYINPAMNLKPRHLDRMFNQMQAPYVIVGDFNALSTEWSCFSNNKKGEILSDALDKYEASFSNNGSFTRLQLPPRISSAIDLTITNANNALNCDGLRQSQVAGVIIFPC